MSAARRSNQRHGHRPARNSDDRGVPHACLVPIGDVRPAEERQGAEAENPRPRITLSARPPVGTTPQRVVLTAELVGGTDDFEEYYCPTIEWDWGDDTTIGIHGRLRALRSRQEPDQAPLHRRARVPACRRLQGLLPPEAPRQGRRQPIGDHPDPSGRTAWNRDIRQRIAKDHFKRESTIPHHDRASVESAVPPASDRR